MSKELARTIVRHALDIETEAGVDTAALARFIAAQSVPMNALVDSLQRINDAACFVVADGKRYCTINAKEFVK